MLYKYNGPAFNSNGQVRKQNWVAYVKAYSKTQAIFLLCLRYKKEFSMCSHVILKNRYLEEVKENEA